MNDTEFEFRPHDIRINTKYLLNKGDFVEIGTVVYVVIEVLSLVHFKDDSIMYRVKMRPNVFDTHKAIKINVDV